MCNSPTAAAAVLMLNLNARTFDDRCSLASPAGGHYTSDVLQPDGRWLRFNDAVVDLVAEGTVLAEKPYLLFYQRVPPRG